MPSQLGLDELNNVLEMISPKYLSGNHVKNLFVFEPYLSKDDRTAVCSLSLSCKALRAGSQRVLMRYISVHASNLPQIFKFLAAKYRNKLPVHKLDVYSFDTEPRPEAIDAAKHLMEVINSCPELEFLSLDGWKAITREALCTPNRCLKRLVTFQYLREWTQDPASFFVSLTAAMPGLRHLVTHTKTTEALCDLPPISFGQLETLSLLSYNGGQPIRWMLSNSYECLHTLQLGEFVDDAELMDALTAFLELVGSRLQVLHIWGGTFQSNSIAYLIHACPNLQDLGIEIIEDDRDPYFPVTEAGEDGTDVQHHPGARSEQDDAQPTMLIFNALCAPLLRLHIISDDPYSLNGCPRGSRLPTLCRALQSGHEKLAKLEVISLEVMDDMDELGVKDYFRHINVVQEEGIVAACRERGIRLRCSTVSNSVEWPCE